MSASSHDVPAAISSGPVTFVFTDIERSIRVGVCGGLPSATPVSTIVGLHNADAAGVAVDPARNNHTGVVVENQNEGGIAVFAPPPAGTDTTPPIRAINGRSTGLQQDVRSVTVDSSGNVYAVTSAVGQPTFEFGPQAVGNATPSARFPADGNPFTAIVDPAGSKLYVASCRTATAA